MRQPFAHEALLAMGPDSDDRAPGAAVTVALCGHWEHEPPCPLAPHRTTTERDGDDLTVQVVFAAEPEDEAEVRQRIEQALDGRWPMPEGFETTWQLRESRVGTLPPELPPFV